MALLLAANAASRFVCASIERQSIISMTRHVAVKYLFTDTYGLSRFPLSVYTKFRGNSGSRTGDSKASLSLSVVWSLGDFKKL